MGERSPNRSALLGASVAAALLAFLAVLLWPAEPLSGAPDLRSLTWLGPSSRWDQSYWVGKAREGDVTWSLAVALCDDPALADRPNCRFVLRAAEQLEDGGSPTVSAGAPLGDLP